MAAPPYPAYKIEPTATPVWLLSAIWQRRVVSPLKSANRSGNDKVWTPGMADRGEPRQGLVPEMERVSRVEPAAVRHAGGERSAKHRFPRGAAGIDKGSAAASLIPFTAPVIKIFRHTPGERNHSTNPTLMPDGATLIRPTPFQRLYTRDQYAATSRAISRLYCWLAFTSIRV